MACSVYRTMKDFDLRDLDAFVDRHPGLRVADLLDILKITKQSLAPVLKQLIDEGWIEQETG